MTEDLAKAMAAASISDSKNQNGNETQEPDFPNKVFLGNLAFKATEKDLKEFFAPAGNV
jgi:RNA recognition motif-containing protein